MMNRLSKTLMVLFMLVAVVSLFSSAARSQTWAQQIGVDGTHFSAMSFLDDFTGYVSGAYGVVQKTTNAGASWSIVSPPTFRSFSDQFFLNHNVGWVVGEMGVIYKTTNGGSTWSQQASGTTAWLNVVHFMDANIGYAAGANGTIIKTTDGGTTWTPQESGTTATIEGACFSTAPTAWLATSGGALLRSSNGGANWQQQNVLPSHSLHDVHFLNSTTGWVVGSGGIISKTTDGGTSWTDLTSGTTMNLNSLAVVDANYLWVVGDGGVILRSTNGGTTWQQQSSSTTRNLRTVFFLDQFHGYAAGLHSTILEYAVVHALPVQLARFTATVTGANTVRLDWTTVSEVNNYGFYVQRSHGSALSFERIPNSFLPGAGTINSPRDYTFTDTGVTAGRWYYRLEQHDMDGTVHYSEPISVDFVTSVLSKDAPVAFALSQNYPNPFNPATTIRFDIASPSSVSLKIFDLTGREVATLVNAELEAGSYQRIFNAEGLSSGTYIYKLKAGTFSETRRLVLMK